MIFTTSFNILTRLLLIVFFFSFQFYIIAQNGYKIEGRVKYAGKSVPKANVTITNSSGEEKELLTNLDGIYSYSLQLEDEYNVSISKAGFTQFQIVYSTIGMTPEIAKKFKDVSRQEIELFELPSDQGSILKLNAILEKPLLSFYFNSENNSFDPDELTNQSFAQNIANVAKLSGAQSSLIETTYKNAISKGDAALLSKSYDVAKSAYNEAIDSKPNEPYPKSKLAEIEKIIIDTEAKVKADAAEKERVAKEKELANAAAKEKAEKDRTLADAAAKEKVEKAKKAADLASENERLAKEAEAAEKERIAKEKTLAENAAKEKAIAEQLEKDRLAKEKADKENALAGAAEAERLAKDKEKANALAKAKADEEKTANELAEKDRLAKEAENKALQLKYDNALARGDSALKTKNYELAKTFYLNASSIKPKEGTPATKIKEADELIELEKRSQYTNELAKKYPQGVTEEIVKEGNVKVTKRIVVLGNKGNLYMKKETSFGTIYYFKDDIAISEAEFNKNTEVKK